MYVPESRSFALSLVSVHVVSLEEVQSAVKERRGLVE
jgi:hypothetical protein